MNITDNQVKVIMFENGELDLMSIDSATYEAALWTRATRSTRC